MYRFLIYVYSLPVSAPRIPDRLTHSQTTTPAEHCTLWEVHHVDPSVAHDARVKNKMVIHNFISSNFNNICV